MSLILDLIFPKTCYGCGRIGDYLCPKCQENLKILSIKPPRHGFDGGLSLVKYHSFIQSTIADLKYRFVSDNAQALGQFCAQKIKSDFPNLLQYWQQNNFILIPIPLHSQRQNWRGFNQSGLLAQEIAHQLSLKYFDQVLIRHQATVVQARLNNIKDRSQNVSNIFSLSKESIQLKNQSFIIFDDVSTTQSTLLSALNTLKTLPPNHCWFLTLAAG